MYFDKISSNEWQLADALKSYEIVYGDRNKAIARMKHDLTSKENDPNMLKSTQTACSKLLKHKLFQKKKTENTEQNNVTNVSNNTLYSQVGILAGNVTMNSELNDIARPTNKRKFNNIDDINPTETEINDMFNQVQGEEINEEAPIYLRLQEEIKIRRSNIKWIVENINITYKFQDYQKECIELANTQGFIMETNAHEILALSSIFLLKPKQNSTKLLQYFTSEEIDTINKNVLDQVCGDDLENVEFGSDTLVKILKILKNMSKTTGKREVAEVELNNLKYLLEDEHERKIIQILINLLQKLPNDQIAEPKGEIELIANYLDPILSVIFTDYNRNKKLIWPNLIQKESNNSQVNQGRRPDAVVRIIQERHYEEAVGFGEAKTIERIKDKYELTRDLVRCCIFAKESIDLNEVNGVMCFQAVGNHLCFYISTLIKEGVYVFSEICWLQIPESIKDLNGFCGELDKILQVLKIFEYCCVTSSTSIAIEDKRPTLNSPSFRTYVDKSKSKYNKCHISF